MIKDKLRPYFKMIRVILKNLLEVLRITKFTLSYEFNRKRSNPKLKVINLNAIDICNSKCQMCNIWKQREDKKISPDYFREILSDKLFSSVEHVGVTGGEPTLRDDLLEIYKAIVEVLPKIKGVSIISNAIRSDDVIQKITSISDYCKSKNVSFGAMLSLDGFASVHDKIRGIPGNFIKTEKVIKALQEENIPLSIGATISKDNVWDVDELLFYLKENKIYGRFRVAEYIKRLYNEDSKVIRAFNEDEIYQLAIFFHKLELTFEKHDLYKRTYRNIRKMLLGSKRIIGCPYHSEGVVLNSEGEISYCAPKSPVLGNGLKVSPATLYKNSLSDREEVYQKNCGDCIHDYHYPEMLKEFIERKSESFQKEFFFSKNRKFAEALIKTLTLVGPPVRQTQKRKVLILGWYGTETVGDKAILGGIIESYLKESKNVDFIIGSIVPYITIRTMKELGYKAEVVSSKSFQIFDSIRNVDEVVMGGGPLMDLDDLMVPYNAFLFATKLNIKTTVFGCGIGPLYFPHLEDLVQKILLMATEVKVRDEKSQKYAYDLFKQHGRTTEVSCTGDPAKFYIANNIIPALKVTPRSKNELCLFLREWTHEYARHLSKDDFLKERVRFEKGLKDIILETARKHNVERIRFCHMHNFVIGNDDRDYSLKFIKTYLSDVSDFEITYDKRLSTVDNICQSMVEAKFNLCMRFHSVVFAHSLGTNFLGIDYTLGGKIFNYLKDNSQLDKMLDIASISHEKK